MAHLSPQLQHRFLARLLSPEETLDVVRHLRECDACREELLALRSDKPSSVLDTILPDISDEEHPSADTLGAYLDGALSGPDKADLDEHLRTCQLCREALADLRSFRDELLQSPAQEYASIGISRQSSADARSGWFGRGKVRFFFGFRQPLALASLAAAALLILGFGIVIVRSLTSVGVSGANPGSQITVADDGHQISLAPNGFVNPPAGLSKDELAGLNNLTGPVWRDEPPILPNNVRDALTSLKRAPSVLLGQSPATPPFHVVSPIRTLISSVRPTFKWSAAPGANCYLVHVIADDRTQEEVATSPSLPAAAASSTTYEWTIPDSMSLTPGERYRWYVTAVRDDQEADSPGMEEPQAKFAVLGAGQLAQWTAVKKALPNDRLIDGLLKLKAGLLDEAQADFESLLADPDQTTTAKSFLKRMIQEIERLKEGGPNS